MRRLGSPYSPASNLRAVRDPEALGAISYMALTAFIAVSGAQAATGGGGSPDAPAVIAVTHDREAGE